MKGEVKATWCVDCESYTVDCRHKRDALEQLARAGEKAEAAARATVTAARGFRGLLSDVAAALGGKLK